MSGCLGKPLPFVNSMTTQSCGNELVLDQISLIGWYVKHFYIANLRHVFKLIYYVLWLSYLSDYFFMCYGIFFFDTEWLQIARAAEGALRSTGKGWKWVSHMFNVEVNIKYMGDVNMFDQWMLTWEVSHMFNVEVNIKYMGDVNMFDQRMLTCEVLCKL